MQCSCCNGRPAALQALKDLHDRRQRKSCNDRRQRKTCNDRRQRKTCNDRRQRKSCNDRRQRKSCNDRRQRRPATTAGNERPATTQATKDLRTGRQQTNPTALFPISTHVGKVVWPVLMRLSRAISQGWDSGSEGATSGTKASEGADCHRRRDSFSEVNKTYGSEREC